MPPKRRQGGPNSASDDDEAKPAKNSKRTKSRATQKDNKKKSSVHKPKTKADQINTYIFADESSDDDVLNERASEKSKIEAMEKATKIMY